MNRDSPRRGAGICAECRVDFCGLLHYYIKVNRPRKNTSTTEGKGTYMGQLYSEQTAQRLEELYRSYGYIQYKMSKFEPYDLYLRNKNFLVSKDILTFTDGDGRLMALKPDVTLSIVKNARGGEGLQKVYYRENVYRTSPMGRGFREIMQTGLECVGEIDLTAMGEVLRLAAESLAAIGEDYLLDLSHLGFAAGLLDSGGVEEGREELLRLMGEKNVPALLARCRELRVAAGTADCLSRLAGLYGPPGELLPQLSEMVRNQRMDQALEELRQLCALLEPERLRLDFSIVNDMSYYNGIIFRGYLPKLPSGVLAGGRYDNLLRQLGREGGAVGFAVYMDLLERLEGPEEEFDGDVLLLYGPETPAPAVLQRAEELRRDGQRVRTERRAPEGLRFRRTERMEGAL